MEQIHQSGGKQLDRLVNLVIKLVNKLKSIINKNKNK